MLLINDKAHKDLELLVNGKGILTGEKHDLNLESNVKDLLISRGFHIMRALGDDNKAREWLNKYANLKDEFTNAGEHVETDGLEVGSPSDYEEDNQLNLFDDNKQLNIFESPDGGETIYQRTIGGDEREQIKG